jgi:hypothetical protein
LIQSSRLTVGRLCGSSSAARGVRRQRGRFGGGGTETGGRPRWGTSHESRGELRGEGVWTMRGTIAGQRR